MWVFIHGIIQMHIFQWTQLLEQHLSDPCVRVQSSRTLVSWEGSTSYQATQDHSSQLLQSSQLKYGSLVGCWKGFMARGLGMEASGTFEWGDYSRVKASLVRSSPCFSSSILVFSAWLSNRAASRDSFSALEHSRKGVWAAKEKKKKRLWTTRCRRL